jgi:hypothetical protein
MEITTTNPTGGSIDYQRTLTSIKKWIPTKNTFGEHIPVFKALQNNPALKSFFEDKTACRELLTYVSQCGSMANTSIEVHAMYLGTCGAGAIKFAKEYIATDDTAKRNLQELLIEASMWVEDPQEWQKSYSWETQPTDIAQALLQTLEHPNEVIDGKTALIQAAEYCNLPLAKILIDYEALTDIYHEELTTTPLIEATKNGYLPLVKMLLEAGANTQEKNADNKTALDIALERQEEDITFKMIAILIKLANKTKEVATEK